MTYLYYRESAIQSIISDVFVFVMIVGAMAMNHFYLGDNAVWAVLLFFLAMMVITSRGNKRRKDFTSKKALLEYLKGEDSDE